MTIQAVVGMEIKEVLFMHCFGTMVAAVDASRHNDSMCHSLTISDITTLPASLQNIIEHVCFHPSECSLQLCPTPCIVL